VNELSPDMIQKLLARLADGTLVIEEGPDGVPELLLEPHLRHSGPLDPETE
jgi:hypothetical protein